MEDVRNDSNLDSKLVRMI